MTIHAQSDRRPFWRGIGNRYRFTWRHYRVELTPAPPVQAPTSRQAKRRAAFEAAWHELHRRYSPDSMPRRVRRKIARDVAKQKTS